METARTYFADEGEASGRMYDPVMSSFLSVDRYVQNPSNSQNFNRYSYCLNNPLKYVDPSGWQMNKPYMASYPAWSFGDNMSYEPRDLQYNSPYMFNYSLSGGDGVSYGGGGGSFARTYEYSVVNSSYYINNNFYINRELALREPTIRDVSNAWWKDPSRETRQALVDAGISELNVGVLEKDGLRHGGARIKVDGKEYILPLPTLEVGGDDFYIGVIAPDIDLAPNAGINWGLGINFASTIGSNAIGSRANLWINPQHASHAQKQAMQTKAYNIQKAQKASGVSQKVSDIKRARGYRMSNIGRFGGAAVGVGVEMADMGINREINWSNVAGVVVAGATLITFAGIGPTIGAGYFILDVGSLIFTGSTFGEHLNSWAGGPIIKW